MKGIFRTARALSILGVGFGIAAWAPSAEASAHFDGKWTVTVSSSDKRCAVRYAVPIRVDEGQVEYAGMFRADADGEIRKNGDLKVVFEHKKTVVVATGSLKGTSGKGQWTSPSKDCGGGWVARKS